MHKVTPKSARSRWSERSKLERSERMAVWAPQPQAIVCSRVQGRISFVVMGQTVDLSNTLKCLTQMVKLRQLLPCWAHPASRGWETSICRSNNNLSNSSSSSSRCQETWTMVDSRTVQDFPVTTLILHPWTPSILHSMLAGVQVALVPVNNKTLEHLILRQTLTASLEIQIAT